MVATGPPIQCGAVKNMPRFVLNAGSFIPFNHDAEFAGLYEVNTAPNHRISPGQLRIILGVDSIFRHSNGQELINRPALGSSACRPATFPKHESHGQTQRANRNYYAYRCA
jgi:hypothetical protein